MIKFTFYICNKHSIYDKVIISPYNKLSKLTTNMLGQVERADYLAILDREHYNMEKMAEKNILENASRYFS